VKLFDGSTTLLHTKNELTLEKLFALENKRQAHPRTTMDVDGFEDDSAVSLAVDITTILWPI